MHQNNGCKETANTCSRSGQSERKLDQVAVREQAELAGVLILHWSTSRRCGTQNGFGELRDLFPTRTEKANYRKQPTLLYGNTPYAVSPSNVAKHERSNDG